MPTQYDWDHLDPQVQLMLAAGNNIKDTAELLGISYNALRMRLSRQKYVRPLPLREHTSKQERLEYLRTLLTEHYKLPDELVPDLLDNMTTTNYCPLSGVPLIYDWRAPRHCRADTHIVKHTDPVSYEGEVMSAAMAEVLRDVLNISHTYIDEVTHTHHAMVTGLAERWTRWCEGGKELASVVPVPSKHRTQYR